MKRREFIGTLAAAGAFAVSCKYVPDSIVHDEEPVIGPDDEFIVFISDLHANPDAFQPEKLRKVVSNILSLEPRPSKVIALGDLAYLTGQLREYRTVKECLDPIENAGIELVLAMGNHDRRDVFAEVYPEKAAKSLLGDRYVYIVEGKYADIIVLDSLQQGDDDTTWITEGALDSGQLAWLSDMIHSYRKPFFVSAHHPLKEIGITPLLFENPLCAGFIYGHEHKWITDWELSGWDDYSPILPTLCLPSTGHWGDIGYVKFMMRKDGATAYLCQDDFFFLIPKPQDGIPELWKQIVESHKGQKWYFPYNF